MSRFSPSAKALAVLPLLALSAGESRESVEAERLRDYDAAFSAASDCARPYFPDPNAEPIEIPGYARGAEGTLWVRPNIAGFSAKYYSSEPRPELGEGVREERYESPTHAFTSIVREDAEQGCIRVVFVANPVRLQIRSTGGKKNSGGVLEHSGPINHPNQIQQVTLPTLRRDVGQAVLSVTQNGRAVPGADVRMWAVAYGLPGPYGRTVGHEHIYRNRSNSRPTLHIEDAIRTQTSNPLTRTTDAKGAVTVKIHGDWRGGVESLVATVTVAGQTYPIARPVVLGVNVPHIFWASAVVATRNATAIPSPSEAFPFKLVGMTSEHAHNHFVNENVADNIVAIMDAIWRNDPARKAATAAGQKRWVQLNDMALEYGGVFRVEGEGACNNPDASGGHKTHQRGVEFDISPCYTNADGSRGASSTCWARKNGSNNGAILMNEALVAQFMLGRKEAVIFWHKEQSFPYRDTYHYHVRLNPHI